MIHQLSAKYTFLDHILRRWGQPIGLDELSGFAKDIQGLPLVVEPGTKRQCEVSPYSGMGYRRNIHSLSIDQHRLGRDVVERVSGMSLDDYFQYLSTLGITNINMFPTSQMNSRLAHIHRKENGKIRGRDHILRRPLIYEDDQIKDVYHSAGAGGFARPLKYCRRLSNELAGCRADLTTEIIATLLDGGHRRPRAIK